MNKKQRMLRIENNTRDAIKKLKIVLLELNKLNEKK